MPDGSIVVGVPYEDASLSSPYTLITDRITESDVLTADFKSDLETAIGNLGSALQYTPDFETLEKNIKDLLLPQIPSAPEISLSLNNNWPNTNIPNPVIKDVNVPTGYTNPEAPDALDTTFDYTAGTYDSQLWPPYLQALLSDLATGGTGLTEQVYQGILDREVESRRIINDRARQRLDRQFGPSSGSMMPAGAYLTAVQELEEDIRLQDIDALRTVMIKDFDLADQNTRFTKDLIQRVEAMLRGDFISREDLLFRIASTSKDLALRIYEQKISVFLAQWEGVKAQLEAAKIQADILISRNNGEVETFKARAQVLEAKISAIAAENQAKTDAASAKAGIYATQVQALGVESNLLIEEVRISLEVFKTNLNEIISKEGLNLQAYQSAKELDAEKATAIGRFSAQSVASSLQMTSTSLGYSYGANESISHRYGLTNSLSESYSATL